MKQACNHFSKLAFFQEHLEYILPESVLLCLTLECAVMERQIIISS